MKYISIIVLISRKTQSLFSRSMCTHWACKDAVVLVWNLQCFFQWLANSSQFPDRTQRISRPVDMARPMVIHTQLAIITNLRTRWVLGFVGALSCTDTPAKVKQSAYWWVYHNVSFRHSQAHSSMIAYRIVTSVFLEIALLLTCPISNIGYYVHSKSELLVQLK